MKSFAQGDARTALRTPKPQVKVGDGAEVFLEATHDPAKSHVAWPQIPDSFGKLEVLEKSKIDTVRKGGEELLRQRLLVTGFDSGLFQIPSFTFDITPVNGTPYPLITAPANLLVQTVAVDTTKPIKPIKDIIEVPRVWTDSWPLIAGGLGLVLVIILLAVYFKKRKKKVLPAIVDAPPPPPKIPAHITALAALQKLDESALWQKGEVKEYYVQLTGILRSYIEEGFNMPALESTTDEVLEIVRRHPILMQGGAQIRGILPVADLAKFAKADPTPQEHTEAMGGAVAFIRSTTTPSPAGINKEGGAAL